MHYSKTFEATKAVDYKLLELSSDSFVQNGLIPSKYTCDGIDVNPSIHIDNFPEEAKSLVIIVDDPDAPSGSFCHWVTWNIPVTHEIKEKEKKGAQGMNDFGRHRYNGPCPPSGTHRYNFKVYALDCSLDIPVSSDKMNLEQAMSDHIVAFGILTGKYKR
jgi:Raf kinase inhibitor-like YbhB/YbcL family protein